MPNFRNLQQLFADGGGLFGGFQQPAPQMAGMMPTPQPTMRAWTDPDPRVRGGQVGPAVSVAPSPMTMMMPPPPPMMGQPNLRNSAGVFADYMRQNMVKKTPSFMPPPMGNVGVPGAPTVPTGPIMGGGGGYNGGVGDGGGGGGDGPGYSGGPNATAGGGLFGGTPGANPGLSSTTTGILGAIASGLLGPAAAAAVRGLAGAYNSYNDKQNAINQSISHLAQLQDDAAVDASYGGGIGSGPGGSDGQAGDVGSSDAGSTGAGADTGGPDGSGGDGTGSGGQTDGDGSGWARGGMVTKNRLRGKNPKGPDDGYGALDVGEAVISKRMVKKHPRLVAGLLRG